MILHVPEQYADFTSALMAASSGDEIVLNTSGALVLAGLTTALDDITVRAGTGFTPVLDHTLVEDGGIGLTLGTATGWLFQGITFRDRLGGSAALSCQGSMDLEDCIFEGCDFALRGNWQGTVSRCDFRHVLQYVATTEEDNVRFEACRFISCEVLGLLDLSGAGSVVENCTLIRCRTADGDPGDDSGEDLVIADVVRANTAHSCQAMDPVSSRVIFRGVTSCTNNNAFNCTTDTDLFASPGTLADNTTVDPQHVHLLLDQRLLPTSPLIGAGGSATTTSDRNGSSFLSPPSIGAYESARIDTVTAPTIDTLLVTVDGGVPDAEACAGRESWWISTDDGVRVAVETVDPSGEDGFLLTLHPAMSKGSAYTVRLSPADYGYDEASVTPEADQPDYPLRPYRNVGALMNALGQQVKRLAGRSEATLVRDFLPTDRTIFVDSTLDFPDSGTIFVRDFVFTYERKTDGAFHGIESSMPRLVALPALTLVTLDERAYIPAAG